jgi:hypothetical protein
LKQSEEMAKRILATEKLDLNGRIDLAYKLALGRSANDHERSDVSRYLADYRSALEKSNPKGNVNVAAWASICQTLFQTALFRYLY